MSICTRGGKPLVSRQYVDMTRLRIEGELFVRVFILFRDISLDY